MADALPDWASQQGTQSYGAPPLPPTGSPMAPQSPFAASQPQSSTFMSQDARAQVESQGILAKAQKDQAAWQEFSGRQRPILDSLAKQLSVGPPRFPEQQRLEKPPNPDDFKKYSVEFASAFAVLGALAGKFTRAGGTASLDAFAGAMKGWQEGNLQAYKQASDQWEQATFQTLQNNKMVLDKWKAIVENRRMNLEDKVLSLKMLSMQYQQTTEHNALEADNFGLAMKAYDMNVAAHEKAVEGYLKLRGSKAQADDEMRGKAQFLESPEGQAFIAQQPPEQQMILQGVIKSYGTEGTVAAGDQGLQAQVQQVGEYRVPIQTALSRLPAKDKQKFSQMLQEQYPEYKEIDYSAQKAGATSEARAVGSRLGIIDMNLNAMNALIPSALQASRDVPRGNWVRVNQAVQAYQAGTSNPKVKNFAIKNLNLAELWAKGMNPTGVMRVEDRNLALQMLSMADGPEAYETAVAGLEDFLKREKAAAQKTRAESRGAGAPAAPETAPPPRSGATYQWTPEGGLQ